jgi:protein TonB
VSVLAAVFREEVAMFAGLAAVEQHHGKGWTALVSFTLQGILVSAAVILPLMNPLGLPDMRPHIALPVSLSNPPIRPRQDARPQHGGGISLIPIVVRPGLTFGHRGPASVTDPIAPETPIGDGNPISSNPISSLFIGSYEPPVLHQTEKPRRVSVVMEGNLIHRVEPQYPAIAQQIRLQGTVLLKAFIGADGTIQQVQVISGPGILANAARAAVSQWRYRPYYLNGIPIPVETEITVNFTLSQ